MEWEKATVHISMLAWEWHLLRCARVSDHTGPPTNNSFTSFDWTNTEALFPGEEEHENGIAVHSELVNKLASRVSSPGPKERIIDGKWCLRGSDE